MEQPQNILLVEDEENDVFFMKRAMKKAGIDDPLHVARDGRQAIGYLEGSGPYADRAQHPLPSIVLLDLKLPYVRGMDVLKWIRSQPDLQLAIVIVLTSSKLQSDINEAYRLGANAYLVKPSTPEKMFETARAIKDFWLNLNQPPASSGDMGQMD